MTYARELVVVWKQFVTPAVRPHEQQSIQAQFYFSLVARQGSEGGRRVRAQVGNKWASAAVMINEAQVERRAPRAPAAPFSKAPLKNGGEPWIRREQACLTRKK